MGTDTLGMELLRASGMSPDAPTVGAFCQQWAKLNDEAMPRLHATFLSMFDPVPTMGRFWLLACDGTGLAMAPDASDAETRMPPARGSDGRNECHLTCAYDVARGVFTDMVCQGDRHGEGLLRARLRGVGPRCVGSLTSARQSSMRRVLSEHVVEAHDSTDNAGLYPRFATKSISWRLRMFAPPAPITLAAYWREN